MSLNWDLTKVALLPDTKDERTVWYEQPNAFGAEFVVYDDGRPTDERRLYTNWNLIDSFIWRQLSISTGYTLTQKNLEKTIIRNAIVERLFGGVSIPPLFIEQMIGFQTNVTPITDAQFKTRVYDELRDTAHRENRDQIARLRQTPVQSTLADHIKL